MDQICEADGKQWNDEKGECEHPVWFAILGGVVSAICFSIFCWCRRRKQQREEVGMTQYDAEAANAEREKNESNPISYGNPPVTSSYEYDPAVAAAEFAHAPVTAPVFTAPVVTAQPVVATPATVQGNVVQATVVSVSDAQPSSSMWDDLNKPIGR